MNLGRYDKADVTLFENGRSNIDLLWKETVSQMNPKGDSRDDNATSVVDIYIRTHAENSVAPCEGSHNTLRTEPDGNLTPFRKLVQIFYGKGNITVNIE